MAFASDQHRRWWFANRGSGGGAGGSSRGGGGVKLTQPGEGADLPLSRQAQARERVNEALLSMSEPPMSAEAQARQSAKEDYFTLSESQVRQLEKDAYFDELLNDQQIDRQADYWQGR